MAARRDSRKPRVNFFLSVRLTDPSIVSSIRDAQAAALVEHPGLKAAITCKPESAHFTLFVLALPDDASVGLAQQTLDAAADDIQAAFSGAPCRLDLQGAGRFGSKVFYATPVENEAMTRLRTLVGKLHTRFTIAGLTEVGHSLKAGGSPRGWPTWDELQARAEDLASGDPDALDDLHALFTKKWTAHCTIFKSITGSQGGRGRGQGSGRGAGRGGGRRGRRREAAAAQPESAEAQPDAGTPLSDVAKVLEAHHSATVWGTASPTGVELSKMGRMAPDGFYPSYGSSAFNPTDAAAAASEESGKAPEA